MLTDFKEYLIQKGSIKPLYIPYYLKWVSACCTFIDGYDSTSIDNDQKDRFLAHLAKTHEDWQVKQADTALRLYNFFLSQQLNKSAAAAGSEGEVHRREQQALALPLG